MNKIQNNIETQCTRIGPFESTGQVTSATLRHAYTALIMNTIEYRLVHAWFT